MVLGEAVKIALCSIELNLNRHMNNEQQLVAKQTTIPCFAAPRSPDFSSGWERLLLKAHDSMSPQSKLYKIFATSKFLSPIAHSRV